MNTKYFLLFTLLLVAATSITEPATNELAIETGGSEWIRVDDTGQVGIGITAPTRTLDVDGNMLVRDDARFWGDFVVDYGNSIELGGSSSALVTMVNNDSSSQIFQQNLQSTSSSGITAISDDGTAYWYTGMYNSEGSAPYGGFFGVTANASLSFQTQSTSRLYVAGDGDVGIGTTDPGADLEVYGGHSSDGLYTLARFYAGPGGGASGLQIRTGRYNAGSSNRRVELQAIDGDDLNYHHLILNPDGGSSADGGSIGIGDSYPDAHLEVSADGTTGGSIFMLSSDDSNDGDLFIVQEDGDVGIGITPLATLHVNGTLMLQSGAEISEISIDGTLAGNSDSAVPTEQAVKEYVDGSIPDTTYIRTGLNTRVVSDAEVRYELSLAQPTHPGGFFDIFLDEQKINSSSNISVNTKESGDVNGSVTTTRILSLQENYTLWSEVDSFDDSITNDGRWWIDDENVNVYYMNDQNIYHWENPDPSNYSFISSISSTSSADSSASISSSYGNIGFISENGQYVVSSRQAFENNGIHRFDVSSPHDLSTMSTTPDSSYYASSPSYLNYGTAFLSRDGSRLLAIGGNSPAPDDLHWFNMSTPYDFSTLSHQGQIINPNAEGAYATTNYDLSYFAIPDTGSDLEIYSVNLDTESTSLIIELPISRYSAQSMDEFRIPIIDGTNWYLYVSGYDSGSGNYPVTIEDISNVVDYEDQGTLSTTSFNLSEDGFSQLRTIVLTQDAIVADGTNITYTVIDENANEVDVTQSQLDTEVDVSTLTGTTVYLQILLEADSTDNESPILNSYAAQFS